MSLSIGLMTRWRGRFRWWSCRSAGMLETVLEMCSPHDVETFKQEGNSLSMLSGKERPAHMTCVHRRRQDLLATCAVHAPYHQGQFLQCLKSVQLRNSLLHHAAVARRDDAMSECICRRVLPSTKCVMRAGEVHGRQLLAQPIASSKHSVSQPQLT